MNRFIAALALLTGILAFAPAAVAQCQKCEGKGATPCQAHGDEGAELEKDCLYCSRAASCPQCGGSLEVDCDKCATADARLAAVRKDKADWRKKMQEHFDRIGHEFEIGQSKHFLLFWAGGRATIDKRRVSEHHAMHLYLTRLESLYEQFKAATGATDADFRTVFQVMVWERQKDQITAAGHYTGQDARGTTGTKRMGAVGVYTVWLDPNLVDKDENVESDLYRNIVHNVSHLLLANAWNARWPGEKKCGGWVDEGVAHWFEDKLFGRCTNYCWQEVDSAVQYKGGRWRAPVMKLANDPKRPPFADTASKVLSGLTKEEHALSWSYCDFLIGKDPKAFGAVCRSIKEDKGFRDALKAEFGLTPLTFDEEWKKYVRANYGVK